MELTRRRFLGSLGASAAAGCAHVRDGSARASAKARVAPTFSLLDDEKVVMHVGGLAGPVRLVVAGDTHFAFHDGRDAAYEPYFRRMAQWPAPADVLRRTFAHAREIDADLVLLVGDTMSFPTLANVERVEKDLAEGGVPWLYTAGNHDWNFEGEPGSDRERRAKWVGTRMRGLFQGENPWMYSRVVKGVRVVMIDDSLNEIAPEQLAFWRSEIEKGDPTVLCVHIPIWMPGISDDYCGWDYPTRTDRTTATTQAFRESVVSAQNLVCLFAGHHHKWMVSQDRGAVQFSVPRHLDGLHADAELLP